MEPSSDSCSASPRSVVPTGDSDRLAGDSDRPGRVYLDYAGFAPVDPRVTAVMRTCLEGGLGNPSATHAAGREARAGLESARSNVARLIGGSASGVIFTSGATEANNLALRGMAARAHGRHLAVSAIEHVSVIHCCRELTKQGWDITVVPVDSDGTVDPDAVASALRADTVLASVMAANGEIGTVQPIAEIGRRLRARGVPLHVDGVHAVGRVSLPVDDWGIDLLTVSSNDLYGPPGVGALWVRPGMRLAPLLLGAGQQGGYRSGTENIPAIVGMGVAADLARREAATDTRRLAGLRDRLLDGLLARLPDARRTGAPAPRRLPHHVSLTVAGVKAEAVLMELDLRGLAASSGSACASLTGETSHVLRAIDASPAEAEGSLCFTLGRWTTARDADAALDLVPAAVRRLRAVAGR